MIYFTLFLIRNPFYHFVKFGFPSVNPVIQVSKLYHFKKEILQVKTMLK